MHIPSILSMATLASAAVLLPRAEDVLPGHCCFTLQDSSASSTLQQSSAGYTFFSSSHPDGWYCLDVRSGSKRVLFDDANSACIVASNKNLMCVDPIPGNVAWTLKGDELQYGGSGDFAACAEGSAKRVFGGKRSGCKTIKLKAKGKKGTC